MMGVFVILMNSLSHVWHDAPIYVYSSSVRIRGRNRTPSAALSSEDNPHLCGFILVNEPLWHSPRTQFFVHYILYAANENVEFLYNLPHMNMMILANQTSGPYWAGRTGGHVPLHPPLIKSFLNALNELKNRRKI